MRAAWSKLGLAIACVISAWACQDDSVVRSAHAPAAREIKARMLALGDSYTSGESVNRDESWPFQLADALAGDKVLVEPLTVVAETGWTTTELLNAIAEMEDVSDYDLVTLQIGVNNQFANLPIDVFEHEFDRLLSIAVALARDRPSHVVVLSIPDYTVTPFWLRIDPERTAVAEIDSYNTVAREIAHSHGATWIDITDISRRALDERDLIARDGLHPSARMYAEWVARVYPIARDILAPRPGVRGSP